MRRVVASLCLACGIATAAPNETARDKYKAAAKLAADDANEAALKLVDQGLALAPKDLDLLQLRGVLLLKIRDYDGALAAYQAYLDAGAQGANRREAIKILNSLRPVKTTFIDLTAPTDAEIYLDTKSGGAFCTAPCKKALLPGDYKVIAEKPGWERWTGRVSIEAGQTVPFKVAMVEKASPVSLKLAPEGAVATIDDRPFDPAGKLPAGSHKLVVRLAGHVTYQQEILAREGKPVEIAVVLVPLIPVEVIPATATLLLDGKPAQLDGGAIAVPAGAHTLVAKAGGYQDQTIAIPQTREAGYKLSIKLAEVARPIAITKPVVDRPSEPRLVAMRATAGVSVFGVGDLDIPAQPTFAITAGHPLRVAMLDIELGAGFSYTTLPYDVMGPGARLGERDASMTGAWAAATAVRPITSQILAHADLGAGIAHLGGLVDGNPITTTREAGSFTLPSARFGVGVDYLLARNVMLTISPFSLVYSLGIDGMDVSAVREIAITAGVGYRR